MSTVELYVFTPVRRGFLSKNWRRIEMKNGKNATRKYAAIIVRHEPPDMKMPTPIINPDTDETTIEAASGADVSVAPDSRWLYGIVSIIVKLLQIAGIESILRVA